MQQHARRLLTGCQGLQLASAMFRQPRRWTCSCTSLVCDCQSIPALVSQMLDHCSAAGLLWVWQAGSCCSKPQVACMACKVGKLEVPAATAVLQAYEPSSRICQMPDT